MQIRGGWANTCNWEPCRISFLRKKFNLVVDLNPSRKFTSVSLHRMFQKNKHVPAITFFLVLSFQRTYTQKTYRNNSLNWWKLQHHRIQIGTQQTDIYTSWSLLSSTWWMHYTLKLKRPFIEGLRVATEWGIISKKMTLGAQLRFQSMARLGPVLFE